MTDIIGLAPGTGHLKWSCSDAVKGFTIMGGYSSDTTQTPTEAIFGKLILSQSNIFFPFFAVKIGLHDFCQVSYYIKS